MYFLANQKNRFGKTVSDYWSIYNRFISDSFGNTKIRRIKEADVLIMLESTCQTIHPKKDALKKAVQYLKVTFEYAMRKGYCKSNPADAADPQDYYKECDLSKKSGENKEFSEDELKKLSADLMKNSSNPRALMALLAKETGMRQCEIAALHKCDVKGNYLHIHRQQLLKLKKGSCSQRYYEVPYTKDERTHPDGGRKFPITENVQKIIELANEIPG